jgi:hypothetical protein
MAGIPITGRDVKSYETRVAASGVKQLATPYTKPSEVQQGDNPPAGPFKGREALFNRYYTFFYNGDMGGSGTETINLFDDEAGWNPLEVERNPTASKLIEWSREGRNAIEYSWEDFLYCKNYGKVPNNYMITLRRFGTPVGDNLLNSERQSTPDIGRLITWMDGETNKLNEMLKFSVKLNWEEFKSEIQTVNASSYGGNGGGGNLIGKLLGATDTAGSKTALQGEANANFDPYSNTTNKTLGPINVIDKMMVRKRGLVFEQSLKLVFEYEMRSIDGINGKAAFLDLLMNVMMVTYNRGDFWGGAIRYVGGKRVSNPIAGQDGMAALARGDWGTFLDKLTTGFSDRLNDLTGGAGLSLEGIGNAIKTVGGNVASRAAGASMDKMGRAQAQATMALLTGEDTGEWHVTVGNPSRPILTMGNMILEGTDVQFDGPLDKDDFPTRLTVTCTLKPARPRDRDDVQMMFAPNNGERLYSSALDYIKKSYYGQVGPNFGGSGDQTKPGSPSQMATAMSDQNAAMNAEEGARENYLAQRFPNFQKDSGIVENVAKWTT